MHFMYLYKYIVRTLDVLSARKLVIYVRTPEVLDVLMSSMLTSVVMKRLSVL